MSLKNPLKITVRSPNGSTAINSILADSTGHMELEPFLQEASKQLQFPVGVEGGREQNPLSFFFHDLEHSGLCDGVTHQIGGWSSRS